MRRRLPLAIGLVAIGAIAVALAVAPRTGTARGVIVAVEATSIDNVAGFTLRMTGGQTMRFALGQLENAAEFPEGHLVEHIASGVPVVVAYRDVGGTPTAYRIEDDLGATSSEPLMPTTAPSESLAPQSGSIEGVVIAIEGASDDDVTGFTLRVPSGEELAFDLSRLEDPERFPPDHLRVHMADAYPVVVRYVEEGGRRYALQLDDGEPPDPSG